MQRRLLVGGESLSEEVIGKGNRWTCQACSARWKEQYVAHGEHVAWNGLLLRTPGGSQEVKKAEGRRRRLKVAGEGVTRNEEQ